MPITIRIRREGSRVIGLQDAVRGAGPDPRGTPPGARSGAGGVP